MIHLALILFTISTPAHSGAIGTDVAASGLASTCRLLFRDSEGKLAAICSGSLTSPNKITTAGHCVADVEQNHWKTSVECGYLGNTDPRREEITAGGSHVLTGGPQFKEKRAGSNLKVARSFRLENDVVVGSDAGELEVSPPITTIKPALRVETTSDLNLFFTRKAISGTSSFRLIQKPAVECRAEGYGIDGNGTSGILTSAALHQPFVSNPSKGTLSTVGKMDQSRFSSDAQLQHYSDCLNKYVDEPTSKNMIPILKLVSSMKTIKFANTPGDSGGPLYCRTSKTENWRLLGISSSGGFTATKEMTSNWSTFKDADLIPVEL